MSADDFGAPAPPSPYGDEGVDRDQWGRYKLPDPRCPGSALQGWPRATTLARAIDDTYNLNQWKLRMVAKGMSARGDLATRAASIEVPGDADDKRALQDVAERAMDTAGAFAGRDRGSALHAFTLATHRPAMAVQVPAEHRADVDAYSQLIANHNLIMAPDLMERIVCCPELNVAGQFDRFALCGWDNMARIVDIKTGQRDYEEGFGALANAVQLLVYARGIAEYGVWDKHARTYVRLPDGLMVDCTQALVIHLPAGAGKASLHWVDLSVGARAAEVALAVRALRKEESQKAIMRPVILASPIPTVPVQTSATGTAVQGVLEPTPASASLEELFRKRVAAAQTEDELRDIWTGLGPDQSPAYATIIAERVTDLRIAAGAVGVLHVDGTFTQTPAVPAQETAQLAERSTPEQRIAAATTLTELSALWQELHPAGLWTDEIAALALTARDAIGAHQ